MLVSHNSTLETEKSPEGGSASKEELQEYDFKSLQARQAELKLLNQLKKSEQMIKSKLKSA